ncbi:Kinesin protein [Fasciola gigantica]|uniref:Kinesin-like protein n=1 Tax=Fasciola gigantica TaxID=46835 RepID=A0A504YEB8_FASGI|nr:Kinesin protein [Fasciola gigantica]
MPKAGVVCLHSRRPSGTSTRQFVFDHTFWSCTRDNPKSSRDDNSPTSIPYADQAKVYKALAFPLLMRTLEGYNACLFAYGMTSSGKTFSITGPPENPGIIPRLVDDLFTQIAKKQSSECDYTVEMSYFEIYNERIRDLLSDRTNQSSGLTVREHPTTGPYVEGAKYPFGRDCIENVYNSQINVVDLAGSERQVSSISAVAITASDVELLFHFGLLRDSLGGNAMTAMLATISPSAQHIEESLATLNYAKKAQSIVNKAVINEDPQGRVIRQLIAEVNRLRQESSVRCEPGSPQAYEVAHLREVLVARENEVRELSRSVLVFIEASHLLWFSEHNYALCE